jgi:hypothetical protein
MATYLLCHRHDASECQVVFAAWEGFDRPVRARPALGTCRQGSHALWWTVDAVEAAAALALLPAYVAERTQAVEVMEVPIP